MDVSLQRILSLIPKKEDGSFVHGAIKDFAKGLGLKSGNIVSDWIAGRSESYKGYLYQISVKYNVPVEWLQGETDKKEPTGIDTSGFNPKYMKLSPEDRAVIDSLIDKLAAKYQSAG